MLKMAMQLLVGGTISQIIDRICCGNICKECRKWKLKNDIVVHGVVKMSQDPFDCINLGLPKPLILVEQERPIVWRLPIEEQAEYADGICLANINNLSFLEQQLSGIHGNADEYALWNEVSIGNFAYIALNGPNSDIRNKCQQMLDGYSHWRRTITNEEAEKIYRDGLEKRFLAWDQEFYERYPDFSTLHETENNEDNDYCILL